MDSKFSSAVIKETEEFLQELKSKHETGNFQSAVISKGACNSQSSWDDPFLDISTAKEKEVNGYRNKQLGLTNSFFEGELMDCDKSNSGIPSCDRELQTHSLPPNLKLQSMPNFEISGFRTPRKPDAIRKTSTIPKCPGSTARPQHDNIDNSHTKKDCAEPKETIEKEDTISQKQDVEGPGQATREPFESFRDPKLNDTRRFRILSLVADSTNTQQAQTDFKQTTIGPNNSSTDSSKKVSHGNTKIERSDRSWHESHSGRKSLANDLCKEVTTKPHIEDPRLGAGFVSQSLLANSAKFYPPQISSNQSLKSSTFKEDENHSEEPPRLSQSSSHNQRHEVHNGSPELQETSAKSLPNQDSENTKENPGKNDENNNSSINNHGEESELEGAVGGIDPGTIIPKPTPEELSRRHETSAKCMPNTGKQEIQENPGKNDENNSSSTEPRNNHGEEPELEGAVGGIDAETVISKATPEVLSRRPKLKAKRNRRKKNNTSNIIVPNNQNNDNVLPVENSHNNTESKDIKDTNANAQTANEAGNVSNESKAKEADDAGNAIVARNTECAVGEDSLQAIRDENRRLKESKQCRICRDNDANRMFLPCAHLAACSLCSPAVLNCPQCKAPIRGIVSVYFG